MFQKAPIKLNIQRRTMKKQRLIGRATNLVGTTIDKSESVLHESLTTIELTSKALTNAMEELQNDSIVDLMDSRLAVMQKASEVSEKMKTLGYSEEEIARTLNFTRR